MSICVLTQFSSMALPPAPVSLDFAPVCLMISTSCVPSSCCEMTIERRESAAMPPALRMMCASPREMPKAAAGSGRGRVC